MVWWCSFWELIGLKHINTVTRDALKVGGFLEEKEKEKDGEGLKGKKKVGGGGKKK